jgi:hypothetical protein
MQRDSKKFKEGEGWGFDIFEKDTKKLLSRMGKKLLRLPFGREGERCRLFEISRLTGKSQPLNRSRTIHQD